MLRERRRIEFAERPQCHLAHVNIGTFEPSEQGMRRERRRGLQRIQQMPQRPSWLLVPIILIIRIVSISTWGVGGGKCRGGKCRGGGG